MTIPEIIAEYENKKATTEHMFACLFNDLMEDLRKLEQVNNKDSERLDWIDKNRKKFDQINCKLESCNFLIWTKNGHLVRISADNIRDLIDQAREVI